MTKADIVEKIFDKVGYSKKESAELVEMVFDIIKSTLEKGDKIKIAGFGNFVVKEKADRRGRNPQTGDPIVITARRVLNFKASQLLKQELNDEAAPVASGGVSAEE
jgi:integration host factor subunit alpha